MYPLLLPSRIIVMSSNVSKSIGFYLLGTILLSAGGLYNGFPFLNGDTASYLQGAFTGNLPYERPVFYGYFLKIVSLGFSLWLPALVQSGLLFFLLHKTIAHFIPDVGRRASLLLTLVIAAGTGVWWESMTLLPDIFLCCMLLAILLLVVEKSKSKGVTTLYMLVVFFGAIFHNSHLLILVIFPFVLYIIGRLFKIEVGKVKWSLLVIGVVAFLCSAFTNYIDNGEFTVNRASHVFLMGKLSENGMLKHHLDRRCGDHDWDICADKDSLPITGFQFVWNGDSPAYKYGSWRGNKEEYQEVFVSILKSPKHVALLAYKSAIDGLVQLFQFNHGTLLHRYEQGSNVQEAVSNYYPAESHSSLWSKQFLMQLPFDTLNMWYKFILVFSTAVVFYLFSIGKASSKFILGYTVILIIIILNAYITGNLANISERLNTRVLWVLPAMNVVVICDWLMGRSENSGVKE
jgi:hypothetical protein